MYHFARNRHLIRWYSPERRRALNGLWYTKRQFEDFYGIEVGLLIWHDKELRLDADARAYSRESFRAIHGDVEDMGIFLEQWHDAGIRTREFQQRFWHAQAEQFYPGLSDGESEPAAWVSEDSAWAREEDERRRYLHEVLSPTLSRSSQCGGCMAGLRRVWQSFRARCGRRTVPCVALPASRL